MSHTHVTETEETRPLTFFSLPQLGLGVALLVVTALFCHGYWTDVRSAPPRGQVITAAPAGGQEKDAEADAKTADAKKAKDGKADAKGAKVTTDAKGATDAKSEASGAAAAKKPAKAPEGAASESGPKEKAPELDGVSIPNL